MTEQCHVNTWCVLDNKHRGRCAEIVLRHVIYAPACKAVFGPFSSEGHAQLWAVRGMAGIEHEIVRYIDLLESRDEESSRRLVVALSEGT